MKTTSILAVTIAALLGLASAGGLWWVNASSPRKPYPRASAPPPPSPVFEPAAEAAPTQEEIEREALERNDRLALAIERALLSGDATSQETAFTHFVPRLLQFDASRVTDIVARLPPGAARDLMRNEVARLWITRDFAAAADWLATLDEPERRAGAAAAVDALAASAPAEAIELAERFSLGREDGYVDDLVHGWAQEDIAAAERWVDTRPAGARTEELRARIALVRERQDATRVRTTTD